MERKFNGYIPSGYDSRDYTLKMYRLKETEKPRRYTLGDLGKVLDQGATGMCVAFGLSDFIARHQYKETGKWQDYSKGMIYAHRHSGIQGEGMIPRYALGMVKRYGSIESQKFEKIGTSKEVVEAFNQFREIYDDTYDDSKFNKFESFVKLEGLEEIKEVLLQDKMVGIAVMVNDDFSRPVDGFIKYDKESKVRGGHWINVVGYDDNKQALLIKNSWGTNWGDKGYAWLSYDYPIMESWSIFDWKPEPFDIAKEKIELTVGSNDIHVNGELKELRIAPFLKQYSKEYSALCTELRPIFEAAGYTVKVTKWEDDEKNIVIYK